MTLLVTLVMLTFPRARITTWQAQLSARSTTFTVPAANFAGPRTRWARDAASLLADVRAH